MHKMFHRCKWFHLKEMFFVTLSNHPRSKSENLGYPFFPAKECCLVWFQLAFAAGAMLLFAFPYIHIGAVCAGKMLEEKNSEIQFVEDVGGDTGMFL